jgi:hypothetical protein
MELEQFNQPTIQFLDGMESQLLGLDCHKEGAIFHRTWSQWEIMWQTY